MEVKHIMKIVLCPNNKCSAPIRLSEGSFVGGVNDKGGIIIECDKCKTIFGSKLKNPTDASGILLGGKVIDRWTDDLPDDITRTYSVSEKDLDEINTSMVFGYEKPPKIQFSSAKIPVFVNGKNNFEDIALKELSKRRKEIDTQYKVFLNHYVKNRDTAEKSFIVINYDYDGVKHKAIFAKQIDSEADLNCDNLYLIYHSNVDLEFQIDGIYTRNDSLLFLERFLNRWRYTAEEVLLVVPFIGFNYKNSEEALYQLWNWLEVNIDVSKTKLITRKGTFKLFKQAQDNSGILFEELVKLGLLEPLIEKMNQKDTKYFQQSHAKYYVGVYEDYVEVLSGSFNIHEGKYFENITFKRYNKDFFDHRYLHMFKDFKYIDKSDGEIVHFMLVDEKVNENYVMNSKEFFKKEFES